MGTVQRPRKRLLHEGQRFGLWRVVEYVVGSKGKYLCECEGCGTRKAIPTGNLTGGKTSGCLPCFHKRISEETSAATRIGVPRDDWIRLSNRFYALRGRCERPSNKRYLGYGGRGIRCEFDSAESFVRFATTIPGWDNASLEIDRIDNDGHYEPGNIRFVDRRGNASNTRVNASIEYLGRTYTAAHFHRKFAPRYLHVSTVMRQAREGKTAEQIIEGQKGCHGPYVRRGERGT